MASPSTNVAQAKLRKAVADAAVAAAELKAARASALVAEAELEMAEALKDCNTSALHGSMWKHRMYFPRRLLAAQHVPGTCLHRTCSWL
jgi:hypothetical protein